MDFSGNANLLTVAGQANQVDVARKLHTARARRLRFMRPQARMVRSLKDVAGELPAPGEQLRLVTLENFNAFTFVPFLIQECGRIDHLTAAMYSISQEVTLTLTEMLAADAIGHIDLLISRTVNFRFPARLRELVEVSNRQPRFRVGVGCSHAKIALMTCGESRFVVEGSGNWCHNDRTEQYVFDNNREIYDFHAGWIMECLEANSAVQPDQGA